jgi:hypothetical protein
MHDILTNRAIIAVSGEDAMNFLHNLTTNDIKKYDYCYNYALSNQGRYLFDFFVFKQSTTSFLIDININQADLFTTHLAIYKLRAKVIVEDLSDIYQLVYSRRQPQFKVIGSFRDPRYFALGFRSIIHKELVKDLLLDNEVRELYLPDKYNFAIIDGYEDLIYNRSIPVEYGAEELNAISYVKGCYIGQEIISRAKYQGVVRKKIYKLSTITDDPEIFKGDKIVANGREIGALCSSYKNNAIALIREVEYSTLQTTIITVKNLVVSLSIPSWRT